MAFNWQTFRTRSLTAIIFVVVMLGGLLWNRWSFFVLFSIIHFGAWIEYFNLAGKIYSDYSLKTSAHKILVMLGGWMIMLFFTNDELHIGSIHFQEAAVIAAIICFIAVPATDVYKNRFRIANMGYSITGLLYISLPLALLTDMRNRWNDASYQLSMIIPLLTIFSLWINDTMAYIMGSMIGKTPLSKISPKKTWEGTIGGVLLTIISFSIASLFIHRLSIINTACISGIAAISGTFGDLAESKLKRLAGVKDSGNFMPGHGGFLDRFDSLLFSSVFVWFYAVIIFG